MEEKNQVSEGMRARLSAFSGDAGIAVWGTDNGFCLEYQPHRQMSTASAAKLFILGTVLEQFEQKRLFPDTQLTVRREDIAGGSGILRHLTPGIRLSVRDLAVLMVILSDNTATNMLFDLLGGVEPVNRHLERYGVREARLNRKISDDDAVVAKSSFGEASAAGFADYLKKVLQGCVLGPDYRKSFQDILCRQQYKDMFPRKLPLEDFYDGPEADMIRLGNKTGFMTGIRSDVGFFQIPGKGEYVYAALTEGCSDKSYAADNEASVLIADIGREAFKMICAEKRIRL